MSSGTIVKTKSGIGKTFYSKGIINGKVPVFLHDGRKILCDPKSLIVLGFWDK